MEPNNIPPALVDTLVAAVSAVVTAAAAWLVRKLEKANLRKQGKLND